MNSGAASWPTASLSTSRIWIYGALGLPLALLGYPLGIWLRGPTPPISACHRWVGLIITVAAILRRRDRSHGRIHVRQGPYALGRRKSWISDGVPFSRSRCTTS